jgi:hypothetical protein
MSASAATVTPVDIQEPTPEELAKSQADLNEYVAYMIMGQAFNELRYVDCALTALTNHNLAAGFAAGFAGEKPPDDPGGRQLRARMAVNAVAKLDVMSRWDATRARGGSWATISRRRPRAGLGGRGLCRGEPGGSPKMTLLLR